MNSIGQRTAVNTSGTAFPTTPSWLWGYDTLGQVVKADSSVNTSDRSYEYDSIGNRLKSADSLTLPASNNYTVNALNQYSSLTINNPPSTINPSYDADGNATAYPLPAAPSANSTLTWDAENRMISSTVNGTTTTYQYDSQSRRIAQTTGSNRTLYLYDGWNPIAEWSADLQSASFTLSKTKLWGLDLSGSMQGAGGVGGLLCETLNNQPSTLNFFPTYDGNGNVSEYLSGSGEIVAHYEYDPFGKTTVKTGTKADDFTHRFSTKPLDAATGLYYYGYRWYDPLTGRWPSRDPIEEEGGINLYGFVGNDGVNWVDVLGLQVEKRDCKWVLYFGHGANPEKDFYTNSEGERVPSTSPLSELFRRFANNPRPLPCGNRLGFVECRRQTMNNLLFDAVGENPNSLIPGVDRENDDPLRYDNDHPQRDDNPNHPFPHGYTELKSLWENALVEAQAEVDGGKSCCKTIEVKVECLNADQIPKQFGNRIPEPNCTSKKTITKK